MFNRRHDRPVFWRAKDDGGGPCRLPASRHIFPATLDAAISQKARWISGIALSGWDRLGWRGGAAERWMRLRDRQSLLAALLLGAAYLALALWLALGMTSGGMAALPPGLAALIAANTALLGWRLAMRFGFVAHAYGWREGFRSAPRAIIANCIAMLAARQALARYSAGRRTGWAHWAKTAHVFPSQVPAE